MEFNTAGAATGAAAGSAAGPWGAVIGGVVGGLRAGSSGTSGSGAGGATATPQSSQAAAFGSGIDSSAWIVNFGDGNSNTLDNRQDKKITSTGPTADAYPSAGRATSPYYDAGLYGGGDLGLGAMGLGSVPPVVWLILAGAVVYRMTRKKK